ncbi:MAG: hypothetical protein BWX88_00620 [Planctomycetes bacterium ADurb.Bin126]|nr:MAG: hypothetical protein BWX88_00620 [Planctomycetes bacterium ADurb.Bin126]HOD80904.1 hypothetical protein [Phycisphaerae bacterium]HQL72245.1 hypothetical protein [Phycisphaerae bacterium]
MRCTLLALAALSLTTTSLLSAPPAVKLQDDPPTVKTPKSGDLTGRIANPAKVADLSLVSRATRQTYTPKTWDRAAGRFTFASLPGDARYDLIIKTTDGRQIEGIDLDFCDLRMVRMAAERRKELGLPPERTQKFSADDAKAITEWISKLQDFMEIRRPLYIHGDGRRCTVLLELMRTREHYAGSGQFVWRVELWYFQNEYGGWEKVPNQERVLRRNRIAPGEWSKIHLEYFPELSAQVDQAGYCRPIEFTIPDKGDLSRGRLPNTQPEVKTPPHISGLDVKGDGDNN